MQKVSIIVPIYNVKQYLSRCLDSILSQTYNNIEVICINDGSTDGSDKILEQYQKLDNRIVIYNTEHSCAANSRNFGIDKSTGQYIMFVDSDDYIASIMVEKLVDCMTKTNADIVISDYCSLNFRKDKSDTKYRYYKQVLDVAPECEITYIDKSNLRYYLCFAVTCWNKIYSADFLKSKNLRFPPCPIYEDVVFWADIYLNAEKIYYTPRAFYYYRRRRNGSLMSKRDDSVYYVIDIHKKMAEKFIEHNMYDKMKTILDYIMIRDFCVKIFQLSPPNNEILFNLVKEFKPDINYEELYKLELNEDNREYIDYYRILTESDFNTFSEKTKEHVSIDA